MKTKAKAIASKCRNVGMKAYQSQATQKRLKRRCPLQASRQIRCDCPEANAKIFFSYAPEDEKLRNRLEKHLKPLKSLGLISDWYDREIGAGMECEREIEKHLNTASIILLLVSPDFMASDYFYSFEMKRAMERYEAGEARVIPIILRPCDWQSAPFGKLKALPKDGKAVTNWSNRDEALLDIARAIRRAVEGTD